VIYYYILVLITTDRHGVFNCEFCRSIIDFPIDIGSLISEVLDKFRINDEDIYFKDLC